MLRVLVTGASSPLGGAVCRRLRKSGAHVTGTVRRARAGWSSPDVDEVVILDLEDQSGFGGIRLGYDAVIHVAAASEGTAEELMQSCGLGTARLVERAESVGIRCIVHVSTIAVYGSVTMPAVSAQTPIDHSIPYGAAKWAAECFLANRQTAIRSASVRSPAIAGRQAHRHFLARTLRAMRLGEPIVHVANPNFMFNNIVHEDSLAEFLVHLTTTTPDRYHAVPVGSCDPISLHDIVARLARATDYRGTVKWVQSTSRPFAIDSAYAITLGYRPLSTEETLDRWLRDVASAR